MKLRLAYFDQNERFAKLLPTDGTIERHLTSSDAGEWVLFRLDGPLTYDGRSYDRLLLKSRWRDQRIGDHRPTSVFIVLVPRGQALADGFDAGAFEHVAWGMVSTLG